MFRRNISNGSEPSRASPHEPKVELDAPYLAEMVRRAMEDRYGAESETSGFRVMTTVRSSDQMAATNAVRNGMVEYDRRHGWRGAEAHLDLAAAPETDTALRSQLRRYLSISGMPVAACQASKVDFGRASPAETQMRRLETS